MITLRFLFLGDTQLECEDAADADDDGEISIADPITTLAYMFTGGVALKAPGRPFPWFDPTPDDLSCGGKN
ncbi:MAG: hypothetical protein HY717_12055 [Planctomycetes bacterium]|nr:hypothetical protein [Planctomycetota bacterium]